ncbi:MAG: outer membrane lipoprotein carrier protein LolA, partial [Sciscionella sp.]|nr:outer membrane lipoprotein carrier protein LolA [Sciscionella sp.]
SLPAVSPQALVDSVLTAKVPALGGTVEVDNGLGLPAIPGAPAMLGNGKSQLRVYTDGANRSRVSIPQSNKETTIVDDGSTVWEYDSTDRTVDKTPVSERQKAHQQMRLTDPEVAAQSLVSKVEKSSTVTVDGTEQIAGRSAYALVLTPKPSEKTLVREVRVAIDSQLRIPLELDVYANGSADPALRIGFTDLNVGAQDPSLFTFTPPAGAKVSTPKSSDVHKQAGEVNGLDAKQVGDGWDAVFTGKLPADALSGSQGGAAKSGMPQSGGPTDGTSRGGDATSGMDPAKILNTVGTKVSGPWGTGWVIQTKVASVLLTQDGRFAFGLVPQQVLTQAIGAGK